MKSNSLTWIVVLCVVLGGFVFTHGSALAQEWPLPHQEEFISEMIGEIHGLDRLILDTKVVCNKSLLERQDHQRKIKKRLDRIHKKMDECKNGDTLTDPACRSMFNEKIMRKVEIVTKRHEKTVLGLIPVTKAELVQLRDILSEFMKKDDKPCCRKAYDEARKRMGEFLFEFQHALEPARGDLLKEINGLYVRAGGVLGGGPDAGALAEEKLNARSGLRGPVVAFKVMVTPRNGGKYEAFVKDQRLVTLLLENEVVSCSGYGAKERLTLYYAFGMNGSMGVSLCDLKSIKRLKPYDKDGFRLYAGVVEGRIKKNKKKEAIRLAKKSEAFEKMKKEKAAKKAKEEKLAQHQAKLEEQKKHFALLFKFPPEKGWGLAKKKELVRRKVVVGVYPNKEEQEFLDNFEQWMKLHKEWVLVKKKKR